uniref:Uncharacterized protein n=1 Tax=Panagrolaimus sp. ES5 TaxID=591445 RepID=A0AC34G9S0_9BILA
CINHLDELDSAYSIAFSNDGTRLYGGFRSNIYVFDLEKPSKPLYKIKTFDKDGSMGQKGILSCMAMNPLYSGSYAVGSYNGNIGYYSDQTSKLDILFETTSRNVTHLCYSPDGNKLFYSCSKSNTIQSLDVRFGCKPLAMYSRPVNTSQRIYFEVDKSGKYLISGTTNNEILVFDLLKEITADEVAEPTVRISDSSRVCAGLSLHPTEAVIATSHGERIFPFPKIDDESDSEEDENLLVIDYGVKLWKFC